MPPRFINLDQYLVPLSPYYADNNAVWTDEKCTITFQGQRHLYTLMYQTKNRMSYM